MDSNFSYWRMVIIGVLSLLLIVAISFFFYFEHIYFNYNPKEATFSKLENIRNKKKAKVIRYLDQQKERGIKVCQNSDIKDYFKKLLYLYSNHGYGGIEYAIIESVVNKLFVIELDKFYDLLFIDAEGDVFFSVKKEDDFLGNIHEERFNGVSLFEKIRKIQTRETEFVDYEYYSISDEPASFFITPVLKADKIQGYIVLQLPINDINCILTERQGLGRTGEVYLVNYNQLMITQSRFVEDNTILTKQIDTEAVRNAILEKRGNKIIKDYRDKRVFSSYEQFDYEGTEWIIVAEIDEDEVITEIYLSREKELFNKVTDYLSKYSYQNDIQKVFGKEWKQKNSSVKVDFKEFQKSKNGQSLYTEGIATCTAMTIGYPGKFGYLLHITPTDGSYRNVGFLTRLLLRDSYTDFVERVMSGICRYDILQCEKSQLRIGLMATHDDSFKNIIRKLTEHGVELSQIKVLYKKNYQKVDVVFDYRNDQVWSLWGGKGFKMVYTDEYENAPDIGELIKKLSNYNRV
ncbi:methyl-accepting chemotaxis protein [Candidatus Scalindua japonica]|uniref:Methyl-accepting chemotaxis protein n=1 Tax=Candidatus Scalindua japonica TaxID=1284222 RepID=A0A286TTW9_9BACT|nr:cache domain-containing protein [Candidatus Scalindua japonica]GAX59350.1 methyl-accepting chemotaxis protein [Candidatus Scalindua japonica]